MTKREIAEAKKMKQVPGIVFADGPAGRRARVQESGVEVFEVIKVHKICGHDHAATAKALDMLTPKQIQAAFDYYAAFPEEIERRLALEDEITPQSIRAWNERVRKQLRTA